MRFCIYASIIFKRCFVIAHRNYSSNVPKCSKKSSKMEPPWNILFFGTDEFALHSLKSLCAKLHTGTLIESLGIVTKPGSVVQKFGQTEGLTSYLWPLKLTEINDKYDIGMVVSFGKLLTDDVIKAFPFGCINVHASILPRWRGAAPIMHAIMAGDTETGITIMRIHPNRFDVGEIVRQYRIPIQNNETALQLENKLAKCGSLLLMDCLRDLPRCVQKAVPQSDEGLTYAPKIRSEMSIVFWDKMSARKVFNLHRALNHIYPLSTKWHGTLVKLTDVFLDEDEIFNKKFQQNEDNPIKNENDIKKSALAFLNSSSDEIINKSSIVKPQSNNSSISPGTVTFLKNRKTLQVICFDGNKIIVNKLKISGKSITGIDFYNGFLMKRPKEEWFFKS